MSGLRTLPARRPTATAVGALVLVWLVIMFIEPWSNERRNDFRIYENYSALFLGGKLPYRDVSFEYPPLAAPVIALPGVFGVDDLASFQLDSARDRTYRWLFSALMLGLAIAVLLQTGRLAELTGGDRRWAMLAVALAPLLTGAIVRNRFDLLPVVPTLGALLALLSRRNALAFALLGVGAMCKAYPLIVVPVALAWLLGRGESRAALRGALALFATLAVLVGGWFAISPDGAADSIRYHLDRPVQVESVPASLLLGADVVGGPEAAFTRSYGSNNFISPWGNTVSGGLSLAMAGLVLLLAGAAARGGGDRHLVLASLTAITAFAAFGKVLSPQYLTWLVPLFGLAVGWRMWPLAASLGASFALTLVEFPFLHGELGKKSVPVNLLVALRNVVLVTAVVLAARELLRETGNPLEGLRARFRRGRTATAG